MYKGDYLVALSGGMAAQLVYKCVERGKPDFYQSPPMWNAKSRHVEQLSVDSLPASAQVVDVAALTNGACAVHTSSRSRSVDDAVYNACK